MNHSVEEILRQDRVKITEHSQSYVRGFSRRYLAQNRPTFQVLHLWASGCDQFSPDATASLCGWSQPDTLKGCKTEFFHINRGTLL